MTKSGCNAETPPPKDNATLRGGPPLPPQAWRRVRFYPSYLCGCPSRPSALVRRNLSRRSSLSLIPNKHCFPRPQQLYANELLWGAPDMLFAGAAGAAATDGSSSKTVVCIGQTVQHHPISPACLPTWRNYDGCRRSSCLWSPWSPSVVASNMNDFLSSSTPHPGPHIQHLRTLATHADSPPPLTCSSALAVAFFDFRETIPMHAIMPGSGITCVSSACLLPPCRQLCHW